MSAVGIFDSGVGGLTVAAAFAKALPNEAIIYLGDTARVPYGNKSGEVVKRYAEKCAGFLIGQGVKLLVVACNTASAFALEHLQSITKVPVIGVIEPGAEAVVAASKTRRIAVIGTTGTMQSGAYRRAILQRAERAVVLERACPLLVPLAEEGWTDHPATKLVVRDYLAEVKAHNPDALVLGCTHYPLLRRLFAEELGPSVTLCDSGTAVSAAAKALLTEGELLGAVRDAPPRHRFYITDRGSNFAQVAVRFFGRGAELEHVDL